MVDIGGLEVLMPEKVIGKIGTTERLRSAGTCVNQSNERILGVCELRDFS